MRVAFLAASVALLPPAADAACRQALAIGLDVSGSVDEVEYRLQLDGLAAALTSPEVAGTLLSDTAAPVRITVYDWSGPRDQRILLPWTGIDNAAALDAAAAVLTGFERSAGAPTTALGVARQAGLAMLETQGDCWRRTLDLSGDGISNAGPRPQDLDPAPSDVTVNALVVLPPSGGADAMALTAYFRAYVLSGPDAFVETASGFEDYEEAMRRKLLRELRSLTLGMATAPPLEPDQ